MTTEASNRFGRFLDELPVAVFVLEADGRPSYSNRAARDLLGRGIQAVGLAGDLAEVYQVFLEGSEQPYPTERMPVVRALDGIESYVDDMVIRRPDGDVHLEVWATPIRDALGQIQHALAAFQDITDRKRDEAELRRLALEDPLTRLANRAVLLDHLGRALQRLARSKASLALLFLDLDDFKAINDQLGHGVGDDVLAEVGRRLRRVTRAHELACRVGGDEFVIVCEDLPDAPTAQIIVDRVLRSLNEPYASRTGEVRVTASVGVAVTDLPDHEPEALLAQADQAMYDTKRASREESSVPEAASVRALESKVEGDETDSR